MNDLIEKIKNYGDKRTLLVHKKTNDFFIITGYSFNCHDNIKNDDYGKNNVDFVVELSKTTKNNVTKLLVLSCDLFELFDQHKSE